MPLLLALPLLPCLLSLCPFLSLAHIRPREWRLYLTHLQNMYSAWQAFLYRMTSVCDILIPHHLLNAIFASSVPTLFVNCFATVQSTHVKRFLLDALFAVLESMYEIRKLSALWQIVLNILSYQADSIWPILFFWISSFVRLHVDCIGKLYFSNPSSDASVGDPK